MVNLRFCGSMGNSFHMSLWNLQNERYRSRRISYVTKKSRHHHHKHRAHSDFQHLLQNILGAESDGDCFSGKEGVESKTHSSDYDINSGDSDDEVYIWQP